MESRSAVPNDRRRLRKKDGLVAALVLSTVAAFTGALLLAPPSTTTGGFGLPAPFGGDTASSSTSPRTTPTPPSLAPAPAVLVPADAGTPGSGSALAQRQIRKLLSSKTLGRPGAFVVDASTGQVLLARNARRPRAPASVAKIAVCAAALVSMDPRTRLETRVVAGGSPSEIVLVGGGDSSLTVRPRANAYPRFASLAELADATANKLLARGRRPITVRVDDSLFSGPAVSPAWERGYVRSGVVAPVSALMVDHGRVRRNKVARHRDPALAAGRAFARLLADGGVAVEGRIRRRTAPTGAEVLASVSSPTVSTLVEVVLSRSDNDVAESLARLVAHAQGAPASFEGLRRAVPEALRGLALDTASVRLLDGSGLARGSRLSPQFVGRLLELSTRSPQLRPLVTGLPVAGFSGTLAERFDSGATESSAGLVRAKTGTLSGVTGLAGVVPTRSERLLVFVFLTDRVSPRNALRSRALLDRSAAVFARLDG